MTALEALREQGDREAFPTAYLEGLSSALVLFAAAFNGKQDACWIEEAGLTATCLDVSEDAIAKMKPLYPPDWEFVVGNAYEFSSHRWWDIVTVDCPSGQFDRAATQIGRWCDLARYVVMLGTGTDTVVGAPEDWSVTEVVRRSSYDGGVYWTVLERV